MAGYIRQSTFVDGDTITAALFNNEYNQLVNAFSNTSGHKHDGTTAEGPVIGLIGDAGETSPNNKVLIDTTNNYIEFYVEVSSAPVQQLYIADGAIIPVTNSDIDLGTTSLRFKDTYTDTVTTTGNVSIGGDLTVTGSATISGNLTFGDADTDSINLAAEIDSDIIPNTDGTYDLGSATKEWQDLYIDGTANIDSLVADTADINGGTIDGATIATSDITVGAGKTLDVSSGTLTLADDQISGNKVEGGTIAATTVTTLTSTTGNITTVNSTTTNATTVDTTNIEVTNLKAKDGTSAGSIADSTGVVTLASSVLTTTDINGGTIDGATIGGTTAGAVTFTDLSDGTITITAFADEDDMSSDSATLVPTQQSVKAYVDSQVTAQDLDITTDSGTIAIDLDSETLTVTGGTGLDSSATGNAVTLAIDSTVATLTGSQTLTNKTIDVNSNAVTNIEVDNLKSGVLDTDLTSVAATDTTLASAKAIKTYVDSQVTAQDLDFQGDTGGALSIDLDSESLTIAGGTGLDTVGSGNTVTVNIDSTVATLTGTQTLTNKTLTSPDVNTPDIDGGTIDGTVIGGTTPAAGTFTTLTANTSITGTLATTAQPNITSLGTLTTLTVDDITINGSTISDAGDLTLDVAGDITLNADGGDIFFADADVTYGKFSNASSSLQIKSEVSDADIIFKGNDGGVPITALTLDMSDAGAATFNSTIYSGAITSSGAITLNGSLGTWSVDNQGAVMNFTRATANYIKAGSTGGYLVFQTNGANAALTLNAQQDATFAGNITSGANGGIIKEIGSDISLVQGGIGLRINDSASALTPTTNAVNNDAAVDLGLSNIRFKRLYLSDGITDSGQAGSNTVFNEDGTTADFRVESNNNTHMLFVDGGNDAIGIGTSSPTAKLNIDTLADQGIALYRSTSSANFGAIEFRQTDNTAINGRIGFNTDQLRLDGTDEILFGTGGSYTEKMRIGTSEAVVNEGSEDYDFRVESNTNDHMFFIDGGNGRVNVNGNGPGVSALNVRDNFAITNTGGAQKMLMGNQDSAGANNPTILQAANGRLQIGNGTSWSGGGGGTFTDRFSVASTEIVVNEDSNDTDFRVESNNQAHMLFVDGGNDVTSVGSSGTMNAAFADKARVGFNIDLPGIDDHGGHMFMTQLAAEDAWMDIIDTHDENATGILFFIHAVRGADQNRSYGAMVRYAYNNAFNIMSSNSQNATVEYRVSGTTLQYRITTAGPYVVNLTVMAAG